MQISISKHVEAPHLREVRRSGFNRIAPLFEASYLDSAGLSFAILSSAL
jgi:hypothetical protein